MQPGLTLRLSPVPPVSCSQDVTQFTVQFAYLNVRHPPVNSPPDEKSGSFILKVYRFLGELLFRRFRPHYLSPQAFRTCFLRARPRAGLSNLFLIFACHEHRKTVLNTHRTGLTYSSLFLRVSPIWFGTVQHRLTETFLPLDFPFFPPQLLSQQLDFQVFHCV